MIFFRHPIGFIKKVTLPEATVKADGVKYPLFLFCLSVDQNSLFAGAHFLTPRCGLWEVVLNELCLLVVFVVPQNRRFRGAHTISADQKSLETVQSMVSCASSAHTIALGRNACDASAPSPPVPCASPTAPAPDRAPVDPRQGFLATRKTPGGGGTPGPPQIHKGGGGLTDRLPSLPFPLSSCL